MSICTLYSTTFEMSVAVTHYILHGPSFSAAVYFCYKRCDIANYRALKVLYLVRFAFTHLNLSTSLLCLRLLCHFLSPVVFVVSLYLILFSLLASCIYIYIYIQCLAKVFIPHHFFHVLLCWCLMLDCFSFYTPYTILTKQKQNWKNRTS